MCDWRAEATQTAGRLQGRTIEASFNRILQQRIPSHQFYPGVCFMPGCHNPLPAWQMAEGRYMCESCYLSVVSSGPYRNCLICGNPLPQHQVSSQSREPRELKHTMHPGECIEYHNALAGITLGIIPPTRQIAYQPQPADVFLGYDERPRQYVDVYAPNKTGHAMNPAVHAPLRWKPN